MNDEIPELAMRQNPVEPLGSAADQRVRARMLAALEDAQVDETPAGDSDETLVVDLTTDLAPGTRRPPVRRWLGVGAAAAAAVVAIALVVASDDERPTTGFGNTPPSTTTAPLAIEPLGEIRVGTTWFYRAPVTVGPVRTEAVLRLQVEAIDGPEVVASARVDLAASASIGQARLAVASDGSVELPPLLLDPRARLVDCTDEARLTVSPEAATTSGGLDCDGRIEMISAIAGAARSDLVPGFGGDAVPITVTWRLDGGPETDTVLWLLADVGVVRIDVAADTDDPTTYLLQERTP